MYFLLVVYAVFFFLLFPWLFRIASLNKQTKNPKQHHKKNQQMNKKTLQPKPTRKRKPNLLLVGTQLL